MRSSQPAQDFLIRQTSYEATLDYRSALSNFWRPLPGDAALGVEVKRQTRRAVFGGVDVAGSSFDIFQVTVAYAAQENDRFRRGSGSFVLHLSPGGVGDRNSDAPWLSSLEAGRRREPAHQGRRRSYLHRPRRDYQLADHLHLGRRRRSPIRRHHPFRRRALGKPG